MLEFQPLSAPLLLSIGIMLMVIEMALGSFYIFWFGIGFFIIGAIEFFIHFSGALYQIAAAFSISLILLFTLKNKIKHFFHKGEKEIKDNFLNEKGEGIIKEGMVFYKGTMWEYEPKDLKIKENSHVIVLETKGNIAKIELK